MAKLGSGSWKATFARGAVCLLLLGSFDAKAEVTESGLLCDDRDESANLGPIRDQKDVGWCFANTGADLLTHAFKEDLGRHQISSSFVATNYFFTDVFRKEGKADSIFGSGGGTVRAMQIIADHPSRSVCLQDVDDRMIANGLDLSLAEKLNFYKDLYQTYRAFRAATDPQEVERLKKELEDRRATLKKTRSFLSNYDEELIIKTLDAPTLDEAAMALVQTVCAGHSKKITGGRITFRNIYASTEGGQLFDSRTDFNAVPEGFNLLRVINDALTQRKVVGITYDVHRVLSEKSGGAHASVIVGRKFDEQKKKCMYKVRNSWGSSCRTGVVQETGSDGLTNWKEDPESPAIYDPSIRCEGGNFWLSEDQVKAWVYEVSHQQSSR